MQFQPKFQRSWVKTVTQKWYVLRMEPFQELVAYKGEKFTIEWFYAENGHERIRQKER